MLSQEREEVAITKIKRNIFVLSEQMSHLQKKKNLLSLVKSKNMYTVHALVDTLYIVQCIDQCKPMHCLRSLYVKMENMYPTAFASNAWFIVINLLKFLNFQNTAQLALVQILSHQNT